MSNSPSDRDPRSPVLWPHATTAEETGCTAIEVHKDVQLAPMVQDCVRCYCGILNAGASECEDMAECARESFEHLARRDDGQNTEGVVQLLICEDGPDLILRVRDKDGRDDDLASGPLMETLRSLVDSVDLEQSQAGPVLVFRKTRREHRPA